MVETTTKNKTQGKKSREEMDGKKNLELWALRQLEFIKLAHWYKTSITYME